MPSRNHPGEDLLLRFCDGELRAREAARIAGHLEACWECRTRMEDLKRTIGDYVHYRAEVLLPGLPPPPTAWAGLESDFARIRLEEGDVEEGDRGSSRWLRRPAVWLLAGASALLAAGVGRVLTAPHASREAAKPAVQERVEQPAPPPPPAPKASGDLTAQAFSPARPVPVARALPALGPEDELKVVAALHRAGADLGDPVDVLRTPDQIVVTAAGLEPRRLEAIQEALAGLNRVSVETPKDNPPRISQSALSDDAAASAQPSLLQEALSPAEFQQVSRTVLEASEAMMARAYALRRLAARFPANVEAQLSPEGRQQLVAIRDEHSAALADQASRIGRSLAGVLAASGNPIRASASRESQADWQTSVPQLFARASRTDRILATILAAPKTDAGGNAILAELAGLLGQLEGVSAKASQ